MSSVLNSVFKGRRGKKKGLPLVRAQSPPSPGSFVSPDPDKPFNPYSSFGASQSSLHQAPRAADDLPPDASRRVSSPKVNVDIGTGFSFSEWFTSEPSFQQKGDVLQSRPERNVSLGVTAGGSNGSVGRGAESAAHYRDASGSGHSQGGSLSNGSIRRLPIPPRISEESEAHDGHIRAQSFSDDEIIVIEAPRGRDPTQSPLGSRFKGSTSPDAASDHDTISSHRPAPAPLKIPDGFERRRAASLESSHPDKQPNRSVSPASRRPSQTRSRSRLRSRSRPASTYSRYSDTDIDYDDNLSSAVSGTTLARALVSSYILSPSSSFTTPSPSGQTYARQRGHLARQDSATLPRGELPFTFNRKSLRSSKGSLAPSSRVPSTYWRDRRISGDQIVVMSPEERGGWGEGDVPPVPPVPPVHAGLTPDSSPHANSRRPSPSRSDTGSSGGLTAEWRYSNGARRAYTDVLLDSVPDKKRRRISKISEASGSQAAPSIYPAFGSRSHDSLVSDDDGDELARRSHEPSLKDASDVRSVRRDSQPEKQLSDVLLAADSAAASQDTPGYDTPALSQTHSATSAESPVQTPASAAAAVSHIRTRMSRSYSESSPRRSMGPRPVTLLPIGERPRSQYLPSQLVSHPRTSSESMVRPLSLTSPLQPPVMLAAVGDSPDSPDLLDIMLAGSRVVQRGNGSSSTRVISPPAPISVPPPTSPEYGFLQEDPNSPSTASAVRQTFPETPYAFTPLVSAGFASPQLPQGAPPPSRSTTTRGKPQRPGIQKRALMRHATMMSPPSTAELSGAMPMTPPLTGADSTLVSADEYSSGAVIGSTMGTLAMIEEGMSPISSMSQPSSYTTTPEHSPAPQMSSRPISRLSVEPFGDRPASLVPAKRSLTPLPSPPPTSVPLPLSRSPSPVQPEQDPQEEEEIAEENPAQEPVEEAVVEPSPSVPEDRFDEQTQDRNVMPFPAPLPIAFQRSETPDIAQRSRPEPLPLPPVIAKRASNNSRGPRSRPPPPSGPRKPSGSTTLLSRSRNGSVSSSLNSPPSSSVGSNVAHLFAKGSMSLSSASSPRFQTQPVKFRGMTMEAAQWTWSRQQLQETVSAAIKKSSNASSIRLLPSEVLNGEIPVEVERLEAVSTELRTNYKLAVRKRRMLLDSLRSIADGGELADQSASARLLDDLAELSEQIDHYAEELYIVTDQLSQLRRLQDQHHGSALAMGLHKLNNSIIKHLAEKESLRQKLVEAEAQADDAWKKAEEAARELDELSDKMAMSEGVLTPASSRRSSKVSIARKASLRKAGLRSPSRLRSQRSSVASRSSMVMSPAMRTASFEDVPPVPPIPARAPLALSTADLPSRSSGMTSEGTPLSEIRAMLQAQEELCAMLGISPEDLRVPAIETRPKRSMSLSAALQTPHSPRSFLPRTVSESYTPSTSASESFRFHRRSRTIDDRTAVLATIGMASA
ncbi:hypothetical protein PsYK624_095590 [Phanerochaete sordida]|uniref:Uncharacterized protein n=1 Tax=Phanerochaete sordida TaxID=48140 RepID=A0A9P3LFK9_9APHY|nr:hypothetical protein PsYK624_095590 [Phanerochaete sordida]